MIRGSGPAHAYTRRWLATVAVMLALTSVAASVAQQQQQQTTKVNIENFGKVNENYYRGAQPKEEDLAELKRLGIKTVIDLRKDSKRLAPEWARGQSLNYVNIPLEAGRPATEDETANFLKLVNDPNNWPVYVHCKGGRHRTGALTAVYRITHDGWTADQAYDEMKKYDFNQGFFGGPTAQKNFVYSFYQQHTAATGQR